MSRFTIEFSPDVDKQIEEIQTFLDTPTKADVVRKALSLLSYIVREQKAGAKLIVENQEINSRKEIVTL